MGINYIVALFPPQTLSSQAASFLPGAAITEASGTPHRAPMDAEGRRQGHTSITSKLLLDKIASREVAELLRADAAHEASMAAGVSQERLREQLATASGREGAAEGPLATGLGKGRRRQAGGSRREEGGITGQMESCSLDPQGGVRGREGGSPAERHPDANVWSKLATAK